MSDRPEKVNHLRYQGRLFRPELRYTQGGKAVANGGMSVNAKGDDDQWHSVWFQVEAWEAVAEKLGNIPEKSEVIVEGRLACDPPYGDRDARLKIRVDTVTLVEAAEAPRQQPQADYDDVPF